MDSSLWIDTINFEWSIVYIEGSQVKFPNKIVFDSLNISFVLANSVLIILTIVDPDEMPQVI